MVISAMRKIPVSGACITPAITPAIPSNVKFFSGIYVPIWYIFQRREKRNPLNAPTNNDGANVPPQPPPPLVAAVAKVFVKMTKAMKSMSRWPLP